MFILGILSICFVNVCCQLNENKRIYRLGIISWGMAFRKGFIQGNIKKVMDGGGRGSGKRSGM